MTAIPAPEHVIEARDVWKRYRYGDVLQGVSLGVQHGDVKAILGPSGSGKSTLLRCLGLLEPIDRGEIHLEDPASGFAKRGVAWCPSRSGSWPTSDPTSAWCSSASTCSRISRRCTT